MPEKIEELVRTALAACLLYTSFTQMFWQEGGAVDESFTPAFDTTGVLRSASAG